MTDPYLIPGTEVLRNKLGIADPERAKSLSACHNGPPANRPHTPLI
jgi:hypothetical protein